jgi:hypothetical protein
LAAKLKLIAAAMLSGLLFCSSKAATYSWFVQSPKTIEGPRSLIGKASISASQSESPGAVDFVISNNSTVDCLVRIGWTPIYQNADGELIAKDVSGVSAASVSVEGADGLIPMLGAISLGEIQKSMINLCDSSGKYYVFKPGQSFSGVLRLSDAQGGLGGLSAVLVPECVQATFDAVQAASCWGWDISRAPVEGGAK